MKVYRIEHNGIKIGPANLYWKLCDLNEHLGDDFSLCCLERQAIALAESFIANCDDRGPSRWDHNFQKMWHHAQRDDSHFSYLFGGNFAYFENLLTVLKGKIPFHSKQTLPFNIDHEYTSYVKSPSRDRDFYHVEHKKTYDKYSLIRSFENFKKDTLLAFGSDVWKSIFATDIAGSRFVIACYEVTKAHIGPDNQIAFHQDDILSREIFYQNKNHSIINLNDFSHRDFVKESHSSS